MAASRAVHRVTVALGGEFARSEEVAEARRTGPTAIVRPSPVSGRRARGVESAHTKRALSPHTVSDHVKSIYEKAGVRTRDELSATLFFGEHLPRIQDRIPIGDDASEVPRVVPN